MHDKLSDWAVQRRRSQTANLPLFGPGCVVVCVANSCFSLELHQYFTLASSECSFVSPRTHPPPVSHAGGGERAGGSEWQVLLFHVTASLVSHQGSSAKTAADLHKAASARTGRACWADEQNHRHNPGPPTTTPKKTTPLPPLPPNRHRLWPLLQSKQGSDSQEV